jgi:hypothetical protein
MSPEQAAAAYGPIAPSVAKWLAETAGIERLPGPFRIEGAAAAARRRTLGEVFRRFGDTPLPWVEMGGARGVPFWLCMGSGAVVTLHHDATLYEVAHGCSRTDPADFLAQLEEEGSAIGLDTLLALQAAGAKAGVAAPDDDPAWYRVVRDTLGWPPARLVKLVDTVQLEFLGISGRELDEWLNAEAEKARPAPKRRGKATPPPWPVAEALAAGARELDLSGIAGKRLHDAVLELSGLEVLDLSHNAGLDFDDAFRRLAVLPNLRQVWFDASKLEELPGSFGDLPAIRAVRLYGSVLKGPGNFFDLAKLLPILARLPALEELDVYVAGALADTDALGALRSLRRLTLRSVITDRSAALLAPLGALSELESLVLTSVGRYSREAPPASVAALPRLTSATFDGTDEQWAVFGACPNLTSITAVERGGEAPPDAVLGRDGLRELALEARQWASVPDALFTPSLVALRLQSLGAPLPEALGRCQALETLILERARRGVALPSTLSGLPALRVLEVTPGGDAAATMSGPDPGGLAALEELQLPRSGPWRLRSTPPRLRRFDGAAEDQPLALGSAALEEIDVSGCARLPEGFVGHPGLKRVRWWMYGFEGTAEEAWDALASLPGLEELDVAWLLPGPATAKLRARPIRSLRYANVISSNRRPPDADLVALLAGFDPAHLAELTLQLDAPTPLPDALDRFGNLRVLRLEGLATPVDPARWSRLVSLRRLELRRTRARAADRTAVAKALPGCHVEIVD